MSFFEGPFEAEPNNSYLQANGPLHSGKIYEGYPNDLRDYFSIYLCAEGQITVNLTNHTGEAVQLQLFYQSTNNLVTYDVAPPYEVVHTPARPGWYYIYIFTGAGHQSVTPYNLQVWYTPLTAVDNYLSFMMKFFGSSDFGVAIHE